MLYLVLFVAFVIALLWLFQIVWLDDFYRYSRTRQIRGAAEAVAGTTAVTIRRGATHSCRA